MDQADWQTVTAALAHIPAECMYHGAKLERVVGFAGRAIPCCDTGKQSLDRQKAETVLTDEATRQKNTA